MLGYGYVTPKKEAGKIALMLFATLGIPLALAFYTVAGEIITTSISRLITKIEVCWLKRDHVEKLEAKKLLGSFILLTCYSAIVSKLICTAAFQDVSAVDSSYMIFQTVTTIGYGDIVTDLRRSLGQEIFLMSTGAFSLGLTASLINSIVRVVHGVNIKRVIRRISASRRSWSPKGVPNVSEDRCTEVKGASHSGNWYESRF